MHEPTQTPPPGGTAPMRTYLDGAPLDGAGQTLGEALAAAAEASGERMVVEASADGAPVPGEHLESPPDSAPYAGELRFTSQAAADVVGEAAAASLSALDRIESLLGRAAHSAQLGRAMEAMAALGDLVGEWDGVQRASGLILLALPGAEGEDRLDEAAASLAASLADLQTALQDEDWVSAADVLEGELLETAQSWRAALAALAPG